MSTIFSPQVIESEGHRFVFFFMSEFMSCEQMYHTDPSKPSNNDGACSAMDDITILLHKSSVDAGLCALVDMNFSCLLRCVDVLSVTACREQLGALLRLRPSATQPIAVSDFYLFGHFWR
jgi:hypothetical protein